MDTLSSLLSLWRCAVSLPLPPIPRLPLLHLRSLPCRCVSGGVLVHPARVLLLQTRRYGWPQQPSADTVIKLIIAMALSLQQRGEEGDRFLLLSPIFPSLSSLPVRDECYVLVPWRYVLIGNV